MSDAIRSQGSQDPAANPPERVTLFLRHINGESRWLREFGKSQVSAEYVRRDLANELIRYTVHRVGCGSKYSHECSCGLLELLEKYDRAPQQGERT